MTAPTEAREKGDKRTTLVLLMSGATIAIVLIGTIFAISTGNTADDVRNGNKIQACRSEANSRVTDARTAFDIARSKRDTAATELNLLTNAGLQAAVSGDDPALAEVTVALPSARAEVHDAEAVVIDATAHLLDVSSNYVDAVRLSREDPDTFLNQCTKETQ